MSIAPEPFHDLCCEADALRASNQINDWEHIFLKSIAYREELSEKQQEAYDQIENKIHRIACAAAGVKWWK